MTGYRCKYFRHDCMKDDCYILQLPSWNDLLECFPRNIRPTDIDGMVEVNGRFLFMEEKRQGKGLDAGQGPALRRLARQPNTTVVVFRPGKKSELEVLIYDGGVPNGFQPHTRDWFKNWLRDWCSAADEEVA